MSGSLNEYDGGLEKLLAQLLQTQIVNSNEMGSSFNSQKQTPSHPYYQQPQSQSHGYHPAAASSPLPTPPAFNEGPHHSSVVMSPASEGLLSGNAVRPSTERTASANLLDLLKFNRPEPTTQTQVTTIQGPQEPSQAPSSMQNRQPDLLATLLSASKENKPPPQQSQPQSSSQNVTMTSDTSTSAPSTSDTNNYLLQLLNRPKPQASPKPLIEPSKTFTPPSRGSSAEISDLTKVLERTALEKNSGLQNEETQVAPPSKQGIFTYVNPFEQLAASSPRNRTPKPSASSQSASMPTSIQILKPPRRGVSESSELKRKVDDRTPVSSPGPSKKKSDGIAQYSPPPSASNERALVDKIQGTLPSQDKGKGKEKATVAEALSDTSEKAGKKVEEAVSHTGIEQDLQNMMNAKTEAEFETTAQAAAIAIKQELDKDENKDALRDTLPGPIADAVKELVDEAAQGHIADNWETADTEESESKDRPAHIAKVYNFPVKPWLSISIRKEARPKRTELHDEQITPVTKLKKEFDQIDRNLAAASHNFIVYGMKNGGIRVICQNDAMDMKIFTETHDRIFNVSLSASQSSMTEAIIGTGVSGTVYWASTQGMDRLRRDVAIPAETVCFALPPIRSAGEEVSGGVLKTRARASGDHPEFFAVGRGKYIYIIWPSVILNQGFLKGPTRIVDIEKYLNQRSLKVNTGKAGKDFVFSQDDTVIASLDKAGRVKFWDVRTLTYTDFDKESHLAAAEQIQPREINEPMMTLITTPANEKSWPTSVMFVDRIRPYQKGGYLRYLLVGMKQNHSLQLWDLTLGKPVSEIHLPHEKESDAVCSVSFHPPTGMIIIGHPTRNSIYLLHLSTPKYVATSPAMTQAEFIGRLAAKDRSFKEPSSTAVLSGIREYSFGSQGELRSLALMHHPFAAHPDNPTIFELYAMYSRGLTCIGFKQADLGWDEENQAINSADAVEEGLITTEPLKPLPEFDSPSASPAVRSVVPRAPPKDNVSKEAGRKSTPSNGRTDISRTPQPASSSRVEAKTELSLAPGYNGGTESSPEKTEKRRKKKTQAIVSRGGTGGHPTLVASPADMQPPSTPPPTSNVESTVQGTSESIIVSLDSVGASGPSTSQDSVVKNMEGSASAEMSRLLSSSLDGLYRRLDNEKRVAAAVADAKQEALLRLVSSTLTDNVEKSLAGIVNNNIEQSVLPAVSSVVTDAVHNQLGENLKAILPTELQKELQSVLQNALANVLQTMLQGMLHSVVRELVRNSLPPLITKTLAEIHSSILPAVLPDAMAKALRKVDVSQDIAKMMVDGATEPIQGLLNTIKFRVEEQFNTVLQKDITPAFVGLTAKTVERASIDVQRQVMETFSVLDHERRADNVRIEQLTKLVTGLTETVSTMAAAQQDFQGKILNIVQGSQDQRSGLVSHSGPISQGHPSEVDATSLTSRQPSQALVKTEEQLVIDNVMDSITTAMDKGSYNEAIMNWLQSGHEQEMFDAYFSKFDPSFIREVNPLILLSVCSLVSRNLEGNYLHQRLAWLETVLQAFYGSTNNLEVEIREVTPKIMSATVTRLEHLFMRVSNGSAQDPSLKRISQLVTTTNRILDAIRGSSHTSRSSYGGNSRSNSQSTVHMR